MISNYETPTFETSGFSGDITTQPGNDLEPGTRIKQYELIRELGRGGMGVVYAARDLKLGRRVAMKFLRHVDREVIDRFLVEARATAQCNHDNIVIIYEVDEFHGMPYMVLEFLEGKTLREFMGPFGNATPMPSSRVVELILPVARALDRAHSLGIVHRDLKPENVLVTNGGQVKVLDFGIAKALGSTENRRHNRHEAPRSGDLMLTAEGALVGTLPYMSPEQMGIDEIDHRSDLFGLGLIMFEMIAGRHPVEPLASDTLMANLVSTDPMLSVRSAVPDLADGLVQAIDGCLRKAKADRMSSAGELARRLEDLLPGRHGRQLAEGESPYPGLTAFQEQDADRFFGRSRDVARMVARVRELPLTGIVGPSGVGKSSFIRAGVGPALKASGEIWDVVTLRPGRHPIAALATVVAKLTTRTGPTATGALGEHDVMMHRLRTEPGYLGATLRTRAAATDSHTLLFVDQFEELYTLVPSVEERRAFTAALAAVADDTSAPLRVVVSMRSDFLDRVGEDARFMEELSRGLVFLSAPDRDGLREALEAPVEMVGYRFESSAMVGDMLEALANTPGALPLLQFAAAKLWDARDRDRRLLTMTSYQAIGGISGALATHADDVVRNMSSPMQKLTQRVFRQLVTPERTRAIVEIADIYQLSKTPEEITRVIDLLVQARLLMVQNRSDGSGASVEIVHESLIDRWPTLRRWLDEDQEDAAFVAQLSAAAKQWETKGRSSGLLWRGEAMEEARRWYTARPRTLAQREQAFLNAVFGLAQRGKRVRRTVVIGAFILLSAGAAGAFIALMEVRAAKEKESAALKDAQQATAAVAAQFEALQTAQAREKQAAAQEKKAEEDRRLAQIAAAQAGKALGLSKEQLEAANIALQKKAAEAQAAQVAAEGSRKKAVEAAAEAQRAKAQLQVKLDAEKQRVRQLEEEKRKLSTKLKD
ncbi:MAG: protein kinase [Deltaproteobacteria bacterium]|nr:protein kinase [Deltaproteobacteria bacterium]